MALKDIDKIIRADRYTQDGRDEVCKAIEKETEDKKYNIGEISQKTGLQKTANGWVEPKKAKAGAGKTPQKENPTRSYSFEVGSNGMPKPGTGKQVQTFKTKKEAQEALKKQNAAESKPKSVEEARHEHLVNEYWQSIRKAKLSPVARVAAELDRGTFDDDVINTMGDFQSMEDLARTMISPAFEDDGDIPQDKLDLARRFIKRRYRKLEEEAISGDCAPRKLTGDCKVKVRKG